ncbi:MAG: putative oxidoreductase, partial [Saprospiraceae bacterium]
MTKRTQLSPNGPTFSRLIFGTMRLGVWGANMNSAEYEEIVCKSMDLGVTTFDHADIYGHYTTEGEFGKILKQQPNLRQKMELISKCGINLTTPNRPNFKIKSYDTSKAHILKSAENSLKE